MHKVLDRAVVRTKISDIDEHLRRLTKNRARWASTPLRDRAKILKELRLRLLSVAEDWAIRTSVVKGLEHDPRFAPAELMTMCATLGSFLHRLEGVLLHAGRRGRCPEKGLTWIHTDQLAAKVFPSTWADQLNIYSLYGFEMETWIQPGKPPSQGEGILGNQEGGLAVVLAAGNHGFIGVMDALEQLFKHGRVVVLKYHDLQEPVTPCIEALLEPLTRRGFLWGVQADLEVAGALVYHPLTTHVHMTGGNATHDSIVWGPPGPERALRMEQGRPLLKVPITSELGNISPWIVVPGGAWKDRELKHHVQALTQAVVNNSSANCLAAKVVLLSDTWEHADHFMDMLRAELRTVPPISPFYPGSLRRAEEFHEQHPEAEVIYSESGAKKSRMGAVPIMLLELHGLPCGPQSEHCLTEESFSPTLTVIRLPADSNDEFLSTAVSVCNNRIWGNLTATLIVHPDVEREHRSAVEMAISDLKYGLVAVNAWGGLGFSMETGHWGGFAEGQTLQCPLSGIGSVHNCYMYDHPQKSVLRTPFVSGLHWIHTQPFPVALPFRLSPEWLWRVGRAFAGYMVNGVTGALWMLFSGKQRGNS